MHERKTFSEDEIDKMHSYILPKRSLSSSFRQLRPPSQTYLKNAAVVFRYLLSQIAVSFEINTCYKDIETEIDQF